MDNPVDRRRRIARFVERENVCVLHRSSGTRRRHNGGIRLSSDFPQIEGDNLAVRFSALA
jgi:hypothetical protein